MTKHVIQYSGDAGQRDDGLRVAPRVGLAVRTDQAAFFFFLFFFHQEPSGSAMFTAKKNVPVP